ncbi:MAG: hypothetical protein E6R03_16460 [Hyphomicrobiaceae bacterium]|nr:MAG: hypothetical protein E6R03_16460 [Hyphomicrobiaceae bacterium]
MSAKSDRRKCPVAGCQALIPPHLAMCRVCWNLTPGKHRQAVYHQYRHHPGTAEHQLAIACAVEAVEARQTKRAGA